MGTARVIRGRPPAMISGQRERMTPKRATPVVSVAASRRFGLFLKRPMKTVPKTGSSRATRGPLRRKASQGEPRTQDSTPRRTSAARMAISVVGVEWRPK